jgi:hypothetical protein
LSISERLGYYIVTSPRSNQVRARGWTGNAILIVTAGFIIVAFFGALSYGIEYAFHASYPYRREWRSNLRRKSAG